MTLTVKEICEKFWNIEEEYELNHLKIQDTYPWQLIRIDIYNLIVKRLGLYEYSKRKNNPKSDNIKSVAPFLKNSLLHNPLKGSPKDVIIFDNPKKHMFKGEYQDIYTYFLPSILNRFNLSYEVIEAPYLNKHYTNGDKKDKNGNHYIKYSDKILLDSYLHKTKNRDKLNFTKEELQKIKEIEGAIENKFSDIEKHILVTVDLLRIMEDNILSFQYEYQKYLEIFEIKKPSKIFIVVAYENKAIVAAAKAKGIDVVELQYETINNYHLGYSYPKRTMMKEDKIKEIEYFPNKILTFGDYWNNSCSYPITRDKIITLGFPFFEENSKKYKVISNTSKKKNQILFISQKNIGKELSKIAYELAMELAGKEEETELIMKKEKPKKNETLEEKLKKEPLPMDAIVKKATSARAEDIKDIKKTITNIKLNMIKKREEAIRKVEEEKERIAQAEFDKKEKYEIIYKLNPKEYENWHEEYLYLNKGLEINGPRSVVKFKVIDDDKIPLYNLFARSEYQVGGYSSAIYTGLTFGCKTFIMNIPGIEYVKDLIEHKAIKKIDSEEDIINEIKDKNNSYFKRRVRANLFFKDYDEKSFFDVFRYE